MNAFRMNKNRAGWLYLCLFCTCFLVFFITPRAYVEELYKHRRIKDVNSNFYVENDKKKILWPDDAQCSSLAVRFAVKTDQVYLFSYPRSGNSWTRYLLEAATGVFSGSVYNDARSKALGFYGEIENSSSGRTTAIKTHAQALDDQGKWSFGKRASYVPASIPVILVIRDPRDAVLSFYSLRKAVNAMGSKGFKETGTLFSDSTGNDLNSTEFHKFVDRSLGKWKEMNLDRLLFSQDLLVVFYEDLIRDPIAQLQRMLEFLGFPLDEQRFHCIQKHLEGPAKRKHAKHEGVYTDDEKKAFAYALAEVVSVARMRNIQIPDEYVEIMKQCTALFYESQ